MFLSTDRIADGKFHGRIVGTVRLVQGYRVGRPYEFAEADVIDWAIVDPFGQEEGNIVGKFLDQYRASEGLPR